MKHKIYLVHESVEVLGNVRQQVIKAFACKRTARKFTETKNHKLAQLKKKFESFRPEQVNIHSSKTKTCKLQQFIEVYSRAEYFVKEVELYA